MKNLLLLWLIIFSNPGFSQDSISTYSLHKNITATVFWVGEEGNYSSSWDENWKIHFGGTDSPENRIAFLPKRFTPKENPFYFALPYNNLGSNCPLPDSAILKSFTDSCSGGKAFFKNRWIKIIAGEKICFAQWEDCGPFLTCDPQYVFGSSEPLNEKNERAGIDVSPAVMDFLGFRGMTQVSWQFVNEGEVPGGPWTNTITRSPANWK